MTSPAVSIFGCAILRKEITAIAELQQLNLRLHLYDSALHTDLQRLLSNLEGAIKRHNPADSVVFYGSCHPNMDTILQQSGFRRTLGQDCIDMLLGTELFQKELANGAFFLLEEWAKRFSEIISKSLGTQDPEIIHDIYVSDGRRYILAIRTPCSDDFTLLAEKAAQFVGLPLRWMDVDLGNLTHVILQLLGELKS